MIKRCCNAECEFKYEATPEKPCWGDVEVIDEEWNEEGDWRWIHACEGHAEILYGRPYIPPPPGAELHLYVFDD